MSQHTLARGLPAAVAWADPSAAAARRHWQSVRMNGANVQLASATCKAQALAEAAVVHQLGAQQLPYVIRSRCLETTIMAKPVAL